MRRPFIVIALVLTTLLVSAFASADVTRLDIESRVTVLDGQPFGDAGAYDKLTGTVHFACDPDNQFNSRIVDLEYAPRDEDGRVEASANFMILTPTDPARASGVAYVEVSNRGGKATLSYFQGARGRAGSDPTEPSHFGDGLLMNMGVTIVWIGWQYDVPDRPGVLRLNVPRATNAPEQITGLVRSDWVVDRAAEVLDVAHRNHRGYPVLDEQDPRNVLTVRDGRLESRRVVPREQWSFSDSTHITMDGGFEVGKIYELVYVAADPAIVGLGLAAIRDIASYIKYDESCPFPADHAVSFGVSQTGRFLRHFVYQGFNTDEAGRKVYDGLLIHTAGAGRGSFNHRFGQPSRDAHRYSAFFYPTDIFPFSGRTQHDDETGKEDGLLDHAFLDNHHPNIFYTNTGYEYWGRAAALLHIDPTGTKDVEPLPNERIYHLTSGQHFVSPFPPRDQARIGDTDGYRGNPLDFLVTLRALLVRLIEWVDDGTEPPPSMYPRLDNNTLVAIDELDWPTISGLNAPTVAQEAYRAEYGKRWPQGIVDTQPPALGPAFATRVPQVNSFGNEAAGVPTVETIAPLASFAPWCLRHGAANPHELADFFGTYIPLPRNDEEKQASADGRPTIKGLFPDRIVYLRTVATAADTLIERGLLLPQDRQRVLDRATAQWEWIRERGNSQ